ncbi:hypothetical protein ACFSTC_54015 [Nonomuraea ferruginea]
MGATYGTVVTGSVPISLTLQADDLSALLGVLVTLVALAVQVYSIGYLRDDPPATRPTAPSSACSPRPCCSWCTRATSWSSTWAGRSWVSAPTCSSATGGKTWATPAPPSRRSW